MSTQSINKNDSKTNTTDTDITLGLTYIPNIQFAPFYVAEQNKYFGSNVKLRHHGASEGLFDALLAGNETFVVAGADETLKAMDMNKNLDLVVVSNYYKKYPISIFALEDKGIKIPADLKGKTIGIPGKFGENYYALLLFLKENNMQEKDVHIKEVGYTQLAAMKTQQVDAVVGYTNNDLIQLQENNIKVKTIEITNKANPLISASLITKREYAEKNPKLVEKIKKAMKKGIDFTIKSPEKATDITAKHYVKELDKSKDLGLKILKATNILFDPKGLGSFDTTIDKNQCEAMKKFMLEEKILTQSTDKKICQL
ncbi:ABC transporter substrate-binding protein [Actinomyces sp. zg-332]|uniref:ABC transporter substrate-binding protein n=1 Tax=Actinomyces sp. zg-332 TaxID=2708340 RepID=UPI0014233961|nr:ABC transporter substrate-binding protein [Actinomyces sp. zg-332]QPK94622.1 ABC transporter substrate-binding protein [Actinomyces sp. zg-332]